MNDGVAILLERVKTHPEEFVFDDNNPFAESKWRKILDHYKDYLDPEDVQALKSEMNKLIQEKFTAKIMEELFDPKPEEQLTLDVASMNIKRPNATLSAGTTRGLYSNGVGGNATLLAQQQLQTEHMKAHIEALKVEDRTKLLNKKATTIFGKLFNYL